MKSMTGYGKGVVEANGKRCTVELKSVNHRFLDLSFKMPKTLSFVEDGIRKTIKSKITRGHIDVFVNYENVGEEDKSLIYNQKIASQYVEIAKEMEENFSVKNDISTASLLKCPLVIETGTVDEDEEEVKNLILGACEIAVNNLVAMRCAEGDALETVFDSFVNQIEEIVSKIEVKAPNVVKDYREKLQKRITESLGDVKLDEARLLNEVAVFADRASIDEEIDRLNAHVRHIRDIFKKECPIGREIDFLIQEFNRESNTIASKANDIDITNFALQLKCVIEKMREQVQNIE